MGIFSFFYSLIQLPQRLTIRRDCEMLVKEGNKLYAHVESSRERAKWVLEHFKQNCYENIWRKYPPDVLPIFEEERSRMINKIANIIFNEK
ncbi:hypothetical protein H6769_07870 [Candidatus Peribacteria bacterium]|nr:hypothetical protein [Candidatus Peribacteria bacterium]